MIVIVSGVVNIGDEYFPPAKAAPGGSLSCPDSVFPSTGKEAVKCAIKKKKRIPVPGWKKCLSGNLSCLSLVSYVLTPLSYNVRLPTQHCGCVMHQK